MGLKVEYKRSYNYFGLHQFYSFKTGQTGSTNRSDRSALPADFTCQTGPRTGQTGLRKTEMLHTQPTSVQLDSTLT